MARAAREIERENRRMQRVREREARANARYHAKLQKQIAKEDAAAYREARDNEAADLTAEADRRVAQLQGAVSAQPRAAAVFAGSAVAPDEACRLVFQKMRPTFVSAPFDAATAIGGPPVPPNPTKFKTVVPPLGFIARLLGGAARHQLEVARAATRDAERLAAAEAKHAADMAAWQERAATAEAAHRRAETARAEEVQKYAALIDAWEAGVRENDPEWVIQYLSHILDASDYPEELDEEYDASYNPEARVLTLEYVLPGPEVVPETKSFSYVRARDEIRENARPKSETAAIYRALIAGLTLRTCRELFSAAPLACLEAITFHGVVEGTDPTTGVPTKICLVSVRITRDALRAVQFARVDPVACLQSLGATMSKKPEELVGVPRVDEGGRIDARYAASSRSRK